MQTKVFTMPLGGNENILEEMNHFLRANKIIDIKKELAYVDGNSCWTFCILATAHTPGKPELYGEMWSFTEFGHFDNDLTKFIT